MTSNRRYDRMETIMIHMHIEMLPIPQRKHSKQMPGSRIAVIEKSLHIFQ